MDLNFYNEIITQIQNYKGLTKDCTINLQQKYPNVSRDAIASMVSQECQKRVKLSNYKDTADLENLYSTFKELKHENKAMGFLLDVSIEFGIAPTIIARRALKQYFIELVKEERYEELFSELSDSESESSDSESESSDSESESSDSESELLDDKIELSNSETELSNSEPKLSKIESELWGIETELLEYELDVSEESFEFPSDIETEISTDESQESESTETCEAFQLPLKAMIRLCIQDHSFISDPDLAYEVFQCTLFDDQYSPFAEAVKLYVLKKINELYYYSPVILFDTNYLSNMGQEYELQLQRHLHFRGILYQDEHYLRKHGYDKTPDIKLDVPLLLNGILINWIESKALFGNEEVHNAYVEDQYQCYWNRFGPGLVIYWFGYVETILDPLHTKLVIMDNIPDHLEVIKEPPSKVDKV